MALTEIVPPQSNSQSRGTPCAVCALLAASTAREAAHLNGLLANPDVRYKWLAGQLADKGHDVPHFTIGKHVRGECAARTKLR